VAGNRPGNKKGRDATRPVKEEVMKMAVFQGTGHPGVTFPRIIVYNSSRGHRTDKNYPMKL